jgi:hypothetical protein
MNITDEQIERFIVAHEKIASELGRVAWSLQSEDEHCGLADVVGGLAVNVDRVASCIGGVAEQLSSNTPMSLASELSASASVPPDLSDAITDAAKIIAQSLDGKAKATVA